MEAAGLGLAFTPGPGVAGGCFTLGGGALDVRVCGTGDLEWMLLPWPLLLGTCCFMLVGLVDLMRIGSGDGNAPEPRRQRR